MKTYTCGLCGEKHIKDTEKMKHFAKHPGEDCLRFDEEERS